MNWLSRLFAKKSEPPTASIARLTKDLQHRELESRLVLRGPSAYVAVLIPTGPYQGAELYLPLCAGAVITTAPVTH